MKQYRNFYHFAANVKVLKPKPRGPMTKKDRREALKAIKAIPAVRQAFVQTAQPGSGAVMRLIVTNGDVTRNWQCRDWPDVDQAIRDARSWCIATDALESVVRMCEAVPGLGLQDIAKIASEAIVEAGQ